MGIGHVGARDDSFPGEAVECAGAVRAVVADVRRLACISSHLTDVELTAAARALAVVMQQAEAALVAVTSDAIERGAVYRSTAADAALHRSGISAAFMSG